MGRLYIGQSTPMTPKPPKGGFNSQPANVLKPPLGGLGTNKSIISKINILAYLNHKMKLNEKF